MTRRVPLNLRCTALVFVALAATHPRAQNPLFTTALPPEEFAEHRAALFDKVGDALVVLQGAPETGSYLPFRQNNHFYYLTGVEVPRALVMSPTSTMFALFQPNQPSTSDAVSFASASLPLFSIRAERAARQILAACRRGDAELIITTQARVAVLARTLAPRLIGSAMSMANRLLPSPTDAQGDVAQRGSVSGSGWIRSVLTAPTYAAARRNNEL